jgi:hypothetical protein
MEGGTDNHLLSGNRTGSGGGSYKVGCKVSRKVSGDRSDREFPSFMQPKEVTTKVERVDIPQPPIDPSNAPIDSCDPFTDSTDDGCEDAFAHDLVIDQKLDLPTDQGFLIFRKTESFAECTHGQFDFIKLFSLFGRQLIALRIDNCITNHFHDGFSEFGIETLGVELGQFANLFNDRVDQG